MESLIIKEAVRTFKQIVGRHVYADSNLNALMEDVAKEDRAAPDVLNESDINSGAPCAKFEDASLLVWKQWHSGGIGDAGRYTFSPLLPSSYYSKSLEAICSLRI